MTLHFSSAGHQIVGDRSQQEDAFLIIPLEGREDGSPRLLSLLADGMGGHAGGKQASNAVVQAFRDHFTANYTTGDPRQALRASLDRANQAIADTVKVKPHLQGMGCTLVATLFEEGRLWWLSVGDSHLYLYRKGQFRKLNADHSFGGYLDQLKAQGQPPPQRQDLPRNMLMSAVFGGEISMLDLPDAPFPLQEGDRLILASDGLNTLTDDDIAERMQGNESPLQYALDLVSGVEEVHKPRQDNTSVVVVEAFDAERRAQREAESAPPPILMDEERRKPPVAAIMGGVVLLVLLAAGGYWFLLRPADPPPTHAGVRATPTDTPAARGAANGETAEQKGEEKGPQEIQVFRDRLRGGGEGPEMVVVPSGHFTMGSNQHLLFPDEQPPHEVVVSTFALSRHEITIAQYRRFAEATGRAVPDDRGLDQQTHPVFFVTWADAHAYTEWLSAQTGSRYRLPSEAEWEYAARAGTTTPFWWGTNVGKSNARCFDCESRLSPGVPAPVGSFAANPFGLYDTAGNINEWVEDCYRPGYGHAPRDGSAFVEVECGERTVRGGGFANASSSLRSAKRQHLQPDSAFDNLGFRVLREL